MKKLRHQTFRQRYQIVTHKAEHITTLRDECIADAHKQLLRAMDLYLEHGLIDDRNPRYNHTLPGPFTNFEIIELEDWANWSNLELEGEECVRIWFTTSL